MADRDTNMPVDLVLVRHGQSEGNLYDEIDEQGAHLGKQQAAVKQRAHSGPSCCADRSASRPQEADELKRQLHGRHTSEWRLTDLGRHQAARAGRVLSSLVLSQIGSFDKAYVSSYARAMETAACLDLPSVRYHVHIFLREKETGTLGR